MTAPLLQATRDLAADLARLRRAAADPHCAAWLGLAAPGATLPGGARVPALCHEIDPVQAAFNLGVMLGWEPVSRLPAAAMHDVCVAALLASGDWHARRQRVLAARLPTVGELLHQVAAHDAAPSAAAAVAAVIRLVQPHPDADAVAAAAVIESAAPAPATPLQQALEVGQRAAQAARIALLCLRQQGSVDQSPPSSAPGPLPRAPSLPHALAADASAATLLEAVAAGGIVDDLPIDAFITRLCGT